MVRGPAQRKPILDELERNVGAMGRPESGRQIADKYETVRPAFEFRRAGSAATDNACWWRRNATQQHAQGTRAGIEFPGFADSARLGTPHRETGSYALSEPNH
jgi:hypothetical protein